MHACPPNVNYHYGYPFSYHKCVCLCTHVYSPGSIVPYMTAITLLIVDMFWTLLTSMKVTLRNKRDERVRYGDGDRERQRRSE